jgi:hypothetical protein
VIDGGWSAISPSPFWYLIYIGKQIGLKIL